MKSLHLAKEDATNAKVTLGHTGGKKTKILICTPQGLPTQTETLHRGQSQKEPANGEELVQGDPEADLENAGRILADTTRAYQDPEKNVLVGDFSKMATTRGPDGEIKSHEIHKPKKQNIDDILPVKMGKRIPVKEAFEKFAFGNAYVLTHEDGVQYEFLHGIAKSLGQSQEMAFLGAGQKGNAPLVFMEGGTPYRALLAGQTEGEKYRLVLLTTRTELKKPQSTPGT
jgi:hypothetical protein